MLELPFQILYEDNHLITVVKPAGILSQADRSGALDMLSLVASYLKERYQKPGNVFVGLVHRLDRNVGGTMLFAKTSKGASRISAQMRDGRFFKGYFAMTGKKLPETEGVLVNHLWKDETRNQVFERPAGKLSRLYYRYIGGGGGYHLYFTIPITGRTHQIRAQFAFAGAPLVGDSKYGTASGKGEPVGLWSCVVSISHPVRGEEMVFTSIPNGNPWNFHPAIPQVLSNFMATFTKEDYNGI